MRKNKKLMLGAIAAMGVMAMGVGGVGTFAWYQAAEKGYVKTTNAQNTSISTERVEAIANTEIEVNFVLNKTVGANKIQLSEHSADLDPETEGAQPGYYYKAYDANGVLQDSELASGCSAVWGYELKVNPAGLSTEQIAALTGSKVNVTVDDTANGRVEGFVLESAAVATAGSESYGTTKSKSNITLTAGMLAGTDVVAYFAIYIHGAKDNESFANKDSGTLNFTFEVDITGTAA